MPAMSVDAPHSPRPAWIALGRSALIVFILLLGVVGLAGAGGYWAGLGERSQRQTQAVAELMAEQYQLALDDLQAGRFELARQRLEYILSIDPAYADAAERLAQALPTTTPTATPVAGSLSSAERLARAQAELADGDWDAAITSLTVLRALDPAYEAVRVDGMLYLALRNRGLARINGDQLEAGLFDLGRAEAFGPLDAEAAVLRDWAELYQTANSYWNLNWERAAFYFSQLYAAAPYFKDTYLKYFQAVVKYANELAAAGDPCGAAAQYELALGLQNDPDLADRRDEAEQACALTPTPEATSASGEPTTATPDASPTALP